MKLITRNLTRLCKSIRRYAQRVNSLNIINFKMICVLQLQVGINLNLYKRQQHQQILLVMLFECVCIYVRVKRKKKEMMLQMIKEKLINNCCGFVVHVQYRCEDSKAGILHFFYPLCCIVEKNAHKYDIVMDISYLCVPFLLASRLIFSAHSCGISNAFCVHFEFLINSECFIWING